MSVRMRVSFAVICVVAMCFGCSKSVDTAAYQAKMEKTAELMYNAARACLNQSRTYAAALETAEVSGKASIPEYVIDKAFQEKRKADLSAIDDAMNELAQEVPEGFLNSYDALVSFYDTYKRTHVNLLHPPGTSEIYFDFIKNIEPEIRRKKEAFDQSLPKKH
ncbi:MAG: hypothetical protein JRF69_09945 [Deltaproteobacteria bacterium]|nr:hypothetical protein [Deltaproteobacteria bacterium]